MTFKRVTMVAILALTVGGCAAPIAKKPTAELLQFANVPGVNCPEDMGASSCAASLSMNMAQSCAPKQECQDYAESVETTREAAIKELKRRGIRVPPRK